MVGESGDRDLPDDPDLFGPPIVVSETSSAVHEILWRGRVDAATRHEGLMRLVALPIKVRSPRGLVAESWRIADVLGWAKTYDAEYLALARLLGCPLVTLDAGMRDAAGRLGIRAISP